ncbi:MAG: ATP-dependent helicase, partial [Thermoproteota archaeon]
TYDSAYLRAEELGNRFEFAVFDEVHHLAAEGYSQIGEMMASPCRMGLTATLEREDGRHVLLPALVGGVVYSARPSDMAGRHLAEFDVVRVRVSLTPEEREEYEGLMREYEEALSRLGLRLRSVEDFHRLVKMSVRSREARRALLARNRARKVAFNSEAKVEALRRILEAHRGDKVIIFTEYNEMAERISERFLIPLITHRTPQREREEILEGFRTGRYTKVVTSKVLDEGLDVPDARVAVILGGTGSRREFVQRLGRILRKKEGRAVLYEVVSRGTVESRVSRRRRRALEGG